MIWTAVFLASFLAGLALAVHSMLLGVERWRRKRSARQSPLFNPPTAAALGAGFGATGYLLTSRSDLGWLPVLVLSLVAGAAALTGMIVLMAKWALRTPASPHDMDEHQIQGQVATVTRTMTPTVPGEITYVAWGETHTALAMSLDSSEISEGSEVVIESLEDGVARVELWSLVEQRL